MVSPGAKISCILTFTPQYRQVKNTVSTPIKARFPCFNSLSGSVYGTNLDTEHVILGSLAHIEIELRSGAYMVFGSELIPLRRKLI
jgi:hypothetical protein